MPLSGAKTPCSGSTLWRGLSREKLVLMSVDREVFWLYAGRRASYDEGMTSNH
jgi:hypothetical protein